MPSIEDFLRLSVSELKDIFLDGREPLPRGLLEALEADARRGVRDLAAKIRARRQSNRAEGQRLRHLLKYEKELWERGFEFIAGVDEAGIGPLAGPVVSSAVILPRDCKLRELDDSKLLDQTTRENLARQIKENAIAWATGVAEVDEIDRLNIYHAGLLAMRRAVESLKLPPHYILVDARTIPGCSVEQRGIICGDRLSASIAAASIIAKTTRDAMMAELDEKYPGYGFASHKGYSTPGHFQMLQKLGASPIHRRSFRPVREALGLEPIQDQLFDISDGVAGDAPKR
jgi:ribonuclease HII